MSLRTTLELNHDFLEALIVDDRGELAGLLFEAVSGDPDAAEDLHARYGMRIVAQKAVAEPAPIGATAEA